MRVLIVETDGRIAATLGALLRDRGDSIQQSSPDDAAGWLRALPFDAMVLDAGAACLQSLRDKGHTAPALVVVRSERPSEGLAAFRQGADGVMAQEQPPELMRAQLAALVRRSHGHADQVLVAGELRLDMGSRQVTVSSEPLHVTGKEFTILELLMLRQGKVQSKSAILHHVYSGVDVPEIKIVDVLVCKLRKKLAQRNADGLVATVWGQGYMLRPTPLPAAVAAA